MTSLRLARMRALEMAAQCQGEHTADDCIYYCVHPDGMGHDGKHVDALGRTWTKLFPWNRERGRKAA